MYRGGPAVRSVRLSSGLSALLIEGIAPDLHAVGRMQRLTGTDVWYLSFVVGRDLRVSYRFEVVATPSESTATDVLDPLNPRVYRPDREALRASLLELPGAPSQPWHERDEELGAWRQRKIVDMRGQENDVFVYLPAGFDPQRAEPYPVLVGLDSYSFGIGMPGALLMDHLIATKAIPPTVLLAANLPGGDGLDQMKVTAEYLADRLLPELRAELNLTADRRRVVISGTSRRGLIAMYTAFEKPGAVGNVLSLSGSFYWKPDGESEYEWLTHRFATEETRPLRLFVAAGNLETVVTSANRGHYMVATNRHLRDVLLARGYDVEYWEFAGAHSALSWQDALARGMATLLGEDAPGR
ncbi:MAG: alpha/beta hydrolase-fold protein [Gemmatimonadales bacterium]|nr:alpha/beta hydrolase-fold protein [Gemmatimonadales bacterium]